MAKKTDNDNLIKNPDILYKYSVDILVIASALLLAGFYLNGFNAIRLAFWSILTATVCEDIGCRIMKKTDRKAHNLYAAATGLSIALMLPATTPAYICIIACAFAVIAVLIPFGSARKIPFIPAAAGICFVTVCFPEAVFSYSAVNIGTSSPLFGSPDFISGESFGKMLTYGKSVILNPLENISILTGKTPGPMGTTCILVLIGVAIYLLLKRTENFIISVSFFAVCALYAVAFPRVNSGLFSSVVMELSSGVLAFAGLVLLTNPFTSPKNTVGKIAYGAFAGLLCMLLRKFGVFEESACFAVLITNAVSPAFGDYFNNFTDALREKGIIKKKAPKFSENKPEKVKKEKVKKEKSIKEKAVKEKKKKNTKKPHVDSSEPKEKNNYGFQALSYDDLLKFDDDEISEAADIIIGKESEAENNG